MHEIFEFEQFQKEIDDINLVHGVVKLGSGKWNDESLRNIVREIMISQNLYTKDHLEDKLRELVAANEFQIIKNILRATEGDLQSLGQV